ncbi:hypothetical protein E4U41_004488 [Claviceps citrina]|nr:hypothetical protein E4U41_004488 [Claviceps citrina]
MQLKRLPLAATAAALVIIPELSEPDEALFRALPIFDESSWEPILAASQVVSVPCVQCGGADSVLHLNFSVVDDTRLLLNEIELYPHADPWHGRLATAVASTDGETRWQKLGYSLAVVPKAMGEGAKLQLLDVELKVIEVGDRFVDGVPAVSVKLFKAPSGEVSIAGVDVALSKVSECDSLICHAEKAMADAFKALKGFRPLKGCHGRLRHGKSDALLRGGSWDGPGSRGGSEEQQPHVRPHEHLGHGHEWRQTLTHIAAQVLLPVLMGITAGVGVALFAMAICSLFFRLAASVRGKRSELHAVHSAALATFEEPTVSEKAQLLAVDELEQRYEDGKL